MINFRYALPAVLVLVLSSSACGVRHAATAVTGDLISRGMIDIETEEDTFVAKQVSLPLLKIAEVLHNGDTSNKKFLALLAKSYGNYAFGIAEPMAMRAARFESRERFDKDKRGWVQDVAKQWDEWGPRAKRFYKKGRDYGIASISVGSKMADQMTLPEFKKLLRKFGKKDAEKLFWAAFDWGQYINMSKDDISSVAELPMVDAIVDRIIENDPSFQCGVAYAFKGAMIAGNTMQGVARFAAARENFDKALGYCDGNFLMAKVMFAEWCAGPSGDKKLYDETLSAVMAADASKLPRYRLANELAKERAKLLLK